MSRRSTDADALVWLSLNLAIEKALKNPETLGVAQLKTLKSWAVLGFLTKRTDGVASYTEIRDKLEISQNTMTRVVNVLEHAKYIAREFDGSSGALLLRLKPQGRIAFGAVHSHALEAHI